MTNDSYQQRLQVFGKFALDLAKLSKCEERGVAAIIVDKELTQVLSIGINGGPKGLMNCLCKLNAHKAHCVHAEINALIKDTSTCEDKIMIATLSTCVSCAASIINAPQRFSAVYYLEPWKEDAGIKLMQQAGIRVERLIINPN